MRRHATLPVAALLATVTALLAVSRAAAAEAAANGGLVVEAYGEQQLARAVQHAESNAMQADVAALSFAGAAEGRGFRIGAARASRVPRAPTQHFLRWHTFPPP